MFPLTRPVRAMLAIYRERDTTRPDQLIEHIERHVKKPLVALASLFNHLTNEGKDSDLLDGISSTLTHKYFVHVVPGRTLVLSKKCHIQMLCNDVLLHVASHLTDDDLVAFSNTCRRFKAIASFRALRALKHQEGAR